MERVKSEISPETNTVKTATKTHKSGRVKAKLLGAYYGHPIKDMKLICITGTTGKATVAHFVHHILQAADQRVACLASDHEIKVGMLHKFFSEAWKSGANYVVVTAPAESLKKEAFYGLPIHIAAMTDFVPSTLDSLSAEEYRAAENTLFSMEPDIVVLNHDDAHYDDFKNFAGRQATITYGSSRNNAIMIENGQSYKKGSEANLNLGGTRFTVASWIPGETTISYMAAATAIATALHIAPDPIADGIAAYNPAEEQ